MPIDHARPVRSAGHTRSWIIALASLALLAMFTACSDTKTTDPVTKGASLQIVNAANVAVDVSVDGQVVATNLAASALSPSLSVTSGAHTVSMMPTGITVGGVAVATSVTTSDAYSSAVALTLSSAGALQAAPLADTGKTVNVGRSKLRVMHLAKNALPLDIWRTQPDYQTPISILFPYTYQSGATVESAAGDWQVRIWPTGAGSWTSAMSSISVNIPSGVLRTVVTLDAPGGGAKLVLLDP